MWTSSSQSYFVTRLKPSGGPGLQSRDGRTRAAPPSADGDDRRRQLDARSPGGAGARREQGRCRARHRRVLRLPLRRAHRRARPARDARDACRRDDAPAEDAARRRNHRCGGGRTRAGDDRRGCAPRSTLQVVQEPAGGRVPVDPRRADPRAREARGGAQRPHARAALVLAGRDRAPARDRRAGRAVDRAREALLARAAPGRGAGGAGADLRGGLRVALPRGVARGDREDDDGRGLGHRRRARARGRQDRVAGGAVRRPCRADAAALEAPADRRARRGSRLALHRRGARTALVDRAPCGGRAGARARRDARRARSGDPSPRQEQPADRRVAAAAAGARRPGRRRGVPWRTR